MGTSLIDIYRDLGVNLPHKVIAARVNYKVEDLNFRVYKPKNVEFIDVSCLSGHRVYLRTICMIMAKAMYDIDPKATLRIEHPIGNGYYCCIDNRDNKVSEELIDRLRVRMQQIISEDTPIVCEEQQTPTVVEMFRQRGMTDKVILLETLGFPYTQFFRLGDYIDHFNGVLAPSTGYTPCFDIQSFKNGIVLRIVDMHNPDNLAPFKVQPKMFDTFNEFVRWNKLMGLQNVGDFNRITHGEELYNLIKVSEALHEKKISQIADMILSRQPECRFVMISGPSSSGKTTFSKRLGVQLMVVGIKPVVLSLDNYFVNREATPLDENGQWDFENLHALDLQLLNEHLERIMHGEEVEIPRFNFETGTRQYCGDKLKLTDSSVLIMEGIHALNPDMCPSIPQEAMFKIYVSALTTISLDNHNWVSTTDTRLLRRIVRDSQFRNYSARETISRWPSVRRGEEKWIFPYQENADVMFNSALLFELAVLRKYAEPLLSEVPQYCEEYTEAHRLMKFLRHFVPIHDREIPATSLLREFLGGSSFE